MGFHTQVLSLSSVVFSCHFTTMFLLVTPDPPPKLKDYHKFLNNHLVSCLWLSVDQHFTIQGNIQVQMKISKLNGAWLTRFVKVSTLI